MSNNLNNGVGTAWDRTWSTGDTITADKLNTISGIIVKGTYAEYIWTFPITYAEVVEALDSGQNVFLKRSDFVNGDGETETCHDMCRVQSCFEYTYSGETEPYQYNWVCEAPINGGSVDSPNSYLSCN